MLVRLQVDPDLFVGVLDHAAAQGLVVAENEHAVAVAGVGHRYPSLEVHSRHPRDLPFEHSDEAVRDVSDLLHALHAATSTPSRPTRSGTTGRRASRRRSRGTSCSSGGCRPSPGSRAGPRST